MRSMLFLVLAAATAGCATTARVERVSEELAGGTSVCRPDVRGNEERMMRAFLTSAYSSAARQKFRCRIA